MILYRKPHEFHMCKNTCEMCDSHDIMWKNQHSHCHLLTVSWGVYSSLSHVYVLVVTVNYIMTFLTTYLCTIYSVWIHVNYCQIRLLKTTRDVFEQLSIFLLLQNIRAEWETRFFSIVTQDELVIGDWNKSKWFYLIFVCVVLLMHVGCLKMLLFKVT